MKHLSKILLLFIIISIIPLSIFTSCDIRAKFKFEQDVSNIVRIEIVEAEFNWMTKKESQHVLLEIEDIDKFLNELRNIKYKKSLFGESSLGVYDRILGVKITYNNGEYEVFNNGLKSCYYHDEIGYRERQMGYFNASDFYNLLFRYLEDAENPEFRFLYDMSGMSSIEIVKSESDRHFFDYFSTVSVILDSQTFIEKLKSIDYIYYNSKITQNPPLWDEPGMAVKINYSNGRSEIFSHNIRSETYTNIYGEQMKSYTYIGTFDEEAFYALLLEYCK